MHESKENNVAICSMLHLEEVDVSIRVAEAEDVLLFGVLGNGLDNAVLGQESVAR